jgi:hypothetical protein
MSTTLDLISNKLTELSVKELLLLQEKLTNQLSQRLETQPQTTIASTEQSLLLDLIPGAFRYTPEEIERHLRSVFKDRYDEVKANAKDFDPSKIPPLPRRVVEYIDEDREDMPLPKLLKPYKLEEM